MTEEPLCHCGQPLHYSKPGTRHLVEQFIQLLGPDIKVTGPDGRAWMVPRHYLALHGLRAVDLAEMGFREAAA